MTRDEKKAEFRAMLKEEGRVASALERIASALEARPNVSNLLDFIPKSVLSLYYVDKMKSLCGLLGIKLGTNN